MFTFSTEYFPHFRQPCFLGCSTNKAAKRQLAEAAISGAFLCFDRPLHHDTSTGSLNMYANGVYYPNWRIYKQQPPAILNFNVISHVFYAFAW